MANRSYLYATDLINKSKEKKLPRSVVGISECPYQISLTYKILLSSAPKKCFSSIWDQESPIALYGDYNGGIKKLEEFFQALSVILPKKASLFSIFNKNPSHIYAAQMQNSLNFLNNPANKKAYFFLECAEIFVFSDSDDNLNEGNELLLNEINHIDQHIENFLKEYSAAEPNEKGRMMHDLMLDSWSNILYFEVK